MRPTRPSLSRAALPLLALGAFLAPAAPAAAQDSPFSGLSYETTLEFQCKFPLISNPQPLSIDVYSNIPETAPLGQPVPAFQIGAEATATGVRGALALLGVASLEGSSDATSTLDIPGLGDFTVTVPLTVDSYTIQQGPLSDPLILTASGQTPSLRFPELGTVTIPVDSIDLTLTARDEQGDVVSDPSFAGSDGDTSTINPDCVFAPGSSTVLKTVQVSGPTPTPFVSNCRTPSPYTSGLSPSSGNAAGGEKVGLTVYGYDAPFSFGGVVASGTSSLGGVYYSCEVQPGVTADSFSTSYTLTVPPGEPGSVAVTDRDGDRVGTYTYVASSPTPTPTVTATPTPTPTVTATPTPTPTPFDPGTYDPPYRFDVAGAARLNTLTRGNVGIAGSLAMRLDLDTGAFTADTQVADTKATLKALGFLPVDASLSFAGNPIAANGANTTGTVTNAGATIEAVTSQTIQVEEARIFGINLVFDPRCRTTTPSSITLNGTNFSFLNGGRLSGTFAISNLTDCGFLTFLLSPLTAGTGNQITVDLAPAE